MTKIINNEELKLYWRKYLKNKIDSHEFSRKSFESEHQRLIIDDNELTLEDLPPDDSDFDKFSLFAISFPANKYFNPYIDYLPKIYEEYSAEGKHKESIRNLRGCMFFLQRSDHFTTNWPKSRIDDYREITNHIKKLLTKNE